MKELLEVEFLDSLKDYGFEIASFNELFKNIDLNTHFMTKPHRIKFYHILYFTKSNDYHYIDFKNYKIEDNTLLFLSKDQVHSFSKTANYEGFVILLTDEFLKRNLLNLEKSMFNILLKPSIIEDASSIYKFLFEQLYNDYKNNSSYKEKLNGTLFNYIILKAQEDISKQNLSNINEKYTLIYNKFKNLLYSNYYKNRSVNFYSDLLKITPKHLNVICKEHSKLNTKQIIDNYIILESKRRLISTNKAIKEISYELGFIETTNFIKYFKKHTNISPSSFRQSHSI